MKFKLIIVAAAIGLLAFTADALTQLNIDSKEANEYMLEAVKRPAISFKTDLVDKARSLPVDVRVVCTRELVQLAKAYTQSDDFASDYKKFRNKQLYGKVKRFGMPSVSGLLNKAKDKVINGGNNGEQSYPADPQEMVKKRLEEFMETTADVNFSAKTANGEFIDEEYRRKPDQWKMYYRAGRPVIAAAREEVAKWIEEMNKQ
ncbi:hypothetical protein [Mucilaginibacter pedocola]|uniref:Uncharacterized protein n=1 Tax=Mucilaginibacter pedocola TaxID=1792845 RepID=A0A1S9P642_9SPHI|nr:hypothetical protein [Mucilaginibacter pedocola]OOQ56416.1 hypothetical protein BC343_18370 [Mucilaginibacter pedocola]